MSESTTADPPEGRPGRRLSAKGFHDAGGVDDWRVLHKGAFAHYRTESFADAVRFVATLGPVAEAQQKSPDIDLRPEGVTVRTFSDRDGSLSERDVDLARAITAVARELGLEADPSKLQVVGLAIAQGEGVDTRPFWAAVMGHETRDDGIPIDPLRRDVPTWFDELRSGAPGRGRVHIDVWVPADVAERRVAAALAAGGRIADDSHVPEWWTLASPDNHGVDVAAWTDFEDYR